MLHFLLCLLLIVVLLPVLLQILSVLVIIISLMAKGLCSFLSEMFGMLPALCWLGLLVLVFVIILV